MIIKFSPAICLLLAVHAQTISPSLRFEHAQELVKSGKFQDAATELTELAKVVPNSPVLYNLLGFSYLQQGRNEEAVENFKRALSLKPDFKPALNNLGGIYLLQGRTQEAIQEFLALVQADPADAQALFNLARAELVAGQPSAGIEQLRKAHDAAPGDPSVCLALAQAYVREGQDYKSAIELLNSIRAVMPRSAQWHELVGYSYFKSGDPAQSTAELQIAMDLDPKNQDLYLELSEVFIANHNGAAAIVLLEAAKKLFPNSARIWFALGIAHLVEEDRPAAERALRKSLELDPKLDLAYAVLGHNYKEAGQWHDLLVTADRLIQVNPRNHLGYYYKALGLLASGRDEAQIEALLRKSSELDNHDPEPHYELAKLLGQRGNKEASLRELENIVSVSPQFGPAYYQLYRIYSAKGEIGRSKEAKQAYERIRTERGQAIRKLLVEVRQRNGSQ